MVIIVYIVFTSELSIMINNIKQLTENKDFKARFVAANKVRQVYGVNTNE